MASISADTPSSPLSSITMTLGSGFLTTKRGGCGVNNSSWDTSLSSNVVSCVVSCVSSCVMSCVSSCVSSVDGSGVKSCDDCD